MIEFIGVDMALTGLDFGECASGNVAATDLKLCGHLFLCEPAFAAQAPEVVANVFIKVYVHVNTALLHPCRCFFVLTLASICCKIALIWVQTLI